jgi:hypothetical protein
MNTNSFQIKGWSIVIVSALMAYCPPTYKSGLIAKSFISFGLSVTPATSL